MKHTFSHSFATRLSIYVFSFTLIVFATIMALFYNYNHEKVTSYAIERTHGLLSNIATEISSQLYAQAQLIEGLPVDDPAAYAEAVCSLMK